MKMNTLILFCFVMSGVSCGLVSESNGTFEDDIDAMTLVALGTETRKPLLTLIGLALRNLHPCEQWSPWTPCEAKYEGYYGTRQRTRQCVDKSSSESNAYRNETDIGICEGSFQVRKICPVGSNTTTHGFCLKLHLDTMNRYKAAATCENEGGYLINIDSAEKYDDVKSMLSGFGSEFVRIDGLRAIPSSPWVYKYGSQIPFIRWDSGEPGNSPSQLCLLYKPSTNLWHDGTCSGSLHFLCEFI